MSAGDTLVSSALEPSFSEIHKSDVVEGTISSEQDVESMKPTGVPVETHLGEGGARQAELIQAAWGKHGKLWVFIGLGICMLA